MEVTYRRNYYKKYGRLTEQYPGIPQGYDYTIYKEGDYVVAKNGKTGEIEFSDSRADDLVQQVVSKLEEERFSQHLGATIKFDYGEYVFKKPVIIKKIPVNIVGAGVGGSGHQVGSAIKIDWEKWEGETWNYDVDGDGNEETIYPAFVFQYADDGIQYSATSRVEGLRFKANAYTTGVEQPVGVFANIVSVLKIINNTTFGAALAFFRGAREEGLTSEEINLGLVGRGSYYNKVAFNNMNGISKKLVGISFFNYANEAIVFGNSNIQNYKLGLYIDGDGIRVMGNSFEGNVTAIQIDKYGNFIANNRYEGNTKDIVLNAHNNIIFDLVGIIDTTRNDFLAIAPSARLINLSYYWWDPELGHGGYAYDIIFDQYAKLEAITRSSGKLQLVRTDTGRYLRKEGTVTLSGDGSTVVKFEHGMHTTPKTVIVIPNSQDAAGFKYAYADGTYVYIVYDTAPPTGTDNLKYSYILIV